jgi:UDP-3-O-acyl N-acetylglucosamine deacetylase
VQFRPARENAGIVFVRCDLQPQVRIPTTVRHRIESPRRTTLSNQGACVEMVEHILAALAGMRIDNCEIWVDAPEMPGLDGSSQPFVDVLKTAGIVEQREMRPCLTVSEVTRVGDEECWVEARPGARGTMTIQYRLDFGPNSPIGRETFRGAIDPDSFCRELAPARTFIFEHEAEWLRKQGLAQRVTCRDVLVIGPAGVIDNELRFEDECVRHKVLDMIGDMALSGCDLRGQFVSYRGGHRLNAKLVSALLAEGQIRHHLLDAA